MGKVKKNNMTVETLHVIWKLATFLFSFLNISKKKFAGFCEEICIRAVNLASGEEDKPVQGAYAHKRLKWGEWRPFNFQIEWVNYPILIN